MKVLFVNEVDNLGDQLCILRVIEEYAREFPACRIEVRTPSFHDLYVDAPFISQVHKTSRVSTVWQEHVGATALRNYDRVYRFNLQRDGRCMKYRDAGLHLIQAYAAAIPMQVEQIEPCFFYDDEEVGERAAGLVRKPFIAIAPHSPSCMSRVRPGSLPNKEWSQERWAQLIDRLPEEYHVYSLGGSDELPPKHPRIHPRYGHRLRVVAEMLKQADAFIGLDNGLAHLARAAGQSNIIQIHGTHCPLEWATYPGNTIVYNGGSISDIPVDLVLDHVNRVLGRTRRPATDNAIVDTAAPEIQLSEKPVGFAITDSAIRSEPVTKDLSVVIVNWNTAPLLRSCLDTVETEIKRDRISAEIIVVDNGSTDGSANVVRDEYPGVNLVAMESNIGFARANNLAIERSTGRAILLLNPDTELCPGSLRAMLQHFREHRSTAAVCGRFLNPDGSFQRYYNRFPTFLSALISRTSLRRWSHRFNSSRSYGMLDDDFSAQMQIDQPPAACLMIRREVLDQIGLMDEQFPIFYNDVDLARRIHHAGYAIRYIPEAEIIHHKGASFKPGATAWNAELMLSCSRYFAKHHSRAAAMLLRLAFTAQLAAWTVRNGFRGTFGRKSQTAYVHLHCLTRFLRGKPLFEEG